MKVSIKKIRNYKELIRFSKNQYSLNSCQIIEFSDGLIYNNIYKRESPNRKDVSPIPSRTSKKWDIPTTKALEARFVDEDSAEKDFLEKLTSDLYPDPKKHIINERMRIYSTYGILSDEEIMSVYYPKELERMGYKSALDFAKKANLKYIDAVREYNSQK